MMAAELTGLRKNLPQAKKLKRPHHTLDLIKRIFKTPSAKLGGVLFAIILLISILAPLIAPYDPYAMDFSAMHTGPSLRHLLGTDELGRDILSRLMHGGRFSLALGILADLLGQVIGVTLGSFAGYFGGKVDNIIMRLLDIWQALPSMLLTIIMSAVLGPGFFNTILALGIGSVPRGARLTRGQILSERGKEYLEAAQSINCSSGTIMFSHLLPNIISPSIVAATMQVGSTITMAASLSYLGLGVQLSEPEWGAMLAAGTEVMRSYPLIIFWPGLAIGLCVLSINLIGDGLRDALDPKLRR